MSFNDIIVDKQDCKDNKNNKDTACAFVIEKNKVINSIQIPSHKKKENSGKDDIVNISIKSCKNITSKQALLIIPITKYFSNKKTLRKLITILKGESISLRLIDWFVTNYCKKFNILYNLNDFKDKDSQTDQHIEPHTSPQTALQIAAQIASQTASHTTQQSSNPLNPHSFDNFILVHNNYKGQLKAYSKKNFDPFCRRNRIRFYYDDNKYFITTVGQLNFFKWALENYIINYIQSHIKDVENDMNLRCEIVKKVSTKIKKQDGVIDNSLNTIINEQIQLQKTKKVGITTRKKRKEISAAASKTLSIHNFPMTIEFD
jgi:hypothetical protein